MLVVMVMVVVVVIRWSYDLPWDVVIELMFREVDCVLEVAAAEPELVLESTKFNYNRQTSA